MNSFNDIFDRFERSNLSKIKFKNAEFELELEKETTYVPVSQPTSTSPSMSTAEQVVKSDDYEQVVSPIVGIIYLSPSPEEEAFVHVGSRVSKGDTLCILEAMKVFNELKAPSDGIVRSILQENEALVGEGDVIFELEKC